MWNDFWPIETKNCENNNCERRELIKRSDDNESTVSNRLKTYDEQTLPILDHYRSKGIVKDVDAMQSINDVTSQIEAIISDL